MDQNKKKNSENEENSSDKSGSSSEINTDNEESYSNSPSDENETPNEGGVNEGEQIVSNEARETLNDQINTDNFIQDANGDYWSSAYLEDGQVYYFNTRTRESSWYPPQNISSMYSTFPPNLTNPSQLYPTNSNPPFDNIPPTYDQTTPSNWINNMKNREEEVNQVVDSSPVPNTDWIRHVLYNGQVYYSHATTMETTWELPSNLSIKQEVNDDKLDAEPPEKCKKRPITADPIPGTSWYVVLTGEGKHFYYDHTKQKSTFEKPEELEQNVILDTILDKYEEQKKIIRATSTPVNPVSLKDAVKARLSHHTPYTRGENRTDDLLNEDNKEEAAISENDAAAVEPLADDDIDINKNLSDKKYTYEERLKMFNDLLQEKNVSAFSIYESEVSKLQEDYRFELLPSKDRKYFFNEYLKTRVNCERQEKISALKQKEDDFKSFLQSVVKSSKMSYSDLSIKYSSNPQFRIIKKEKEREALFQEYIAELNKNLAIQTEQLLTDDDKIKNSYFQLLSEMKKLDAHTPWRRVKRVICDDERYIAVTDSKRRESWFDEYVEKKVEEEKVIDQERMKIEREKASIKERERKVNMERKHYEETRSRERGTYLHESAVVEFCSLLTDTINSPKISWNEAKQVMKQDSRWTSINNLSRQDYMNLFDKHIDKLYQKLKDALYAAFKNKGAQINSKWEEIYPLIKDDSRAIKFSTNERRLMKEFEHYQSKTLSEAIESFRSLLMETKMIDNRFLAKSKLIPSLYDELIEILQKDNRFNVLDFMDTERTAIINSYLQELEKKGAPPPPTASIPSTRYNK